MHVVDFAEVCRRRLARHGLLGGHRDLASAAGAVCGIHAQVMSAAEHSLARRAPGTTRQDVRRALWTDRTLTKTVGVRGTVHLYPTAELPFWMAALGAVPLPKRKPTPGLTLTTDEQDRVLDAIGAALTERDLTLTELDDAVAESAGAWAVAPTLPAFGGAAPRWRLTVAAAAYRGLLCYGPQRGRNVTFTSPRRLLPSYADADGPTALRTLALRYLDAYGPATPAELARWLGADPRPIAALVDDLRGELEEVELDGRTAFWPRDRTAGAAPSAPADAASLTEAPDSGTTPTGAAAPPGSTALSGTGTPTGSGAPASIGAPPGTEAPAGAEAVAVADDSGGGLVLAPYFDAYVVGSHPRRLVFPGPAADRALSATGAAGPVMTLLRDGVVAGVWHLRRQGRRLALTVEPFQPLDHADRERLDDELAWVGTILEGTVELTLGAVTARPHL